MGIGWSPSTLQNGNVWIIPALTPFIPAPCAGAGSLTCPVRRGQHDGGDPRDLAIGRAKEILDFFEEDGQAFGEGVGKADGNEGSEQHHPSPATIRRLGGSPCLSSHGRGGTVPGSPAIKTGGLWGQARGAAPLDP